LKGKPAPFTRFYIIGQTKQCINNTMSSTLKTKKSEIKRAESEEVMIYYKGTRMEKINTDYGPRTFKNLG